MGIPSKIFIVPYRDRSNDKVWFSNRMNDILKNYDPTSYEIFFSHQCDNRPFNRGAVKNIGFLAMKTKYPDDYHNITFIFNDIDTVPLNNNTIINYETTTGIVKHYYGFKYALGGIFSIKGSDFEKCKGFPNFWAWGLEDNILNDRCLTVGLKIDRSNFYSITDKTNIQRSFDGFKRIVSRYNVDDYNNKTSDDMSSLKNIKFELTNEYINITQFDCDINPYEKTYEAIDIRIHKKLYPSHVKNNNQPQKNNRRPWKMFNTSIH